MNQYSGTISKQPFLNSSQEAQGTTLVFPHLWAVLCGDKLTGQWNENFQSLKILS